jgi:hypothetical protein
MFVLARKKYAFNMVDYYLSKFEERLTTPYALISLNKKSLMKIHFCISS